MRVDHSPFCDHMPVVSTDVAELTERLLRRVGSDIHDGIGQLLTVALLRLDRLRECKLHEPDITALQNILDAAMNEVRELSSGLSLPHIDKLPIAGAVRSMVLQHEQRTATQVQLTMVPDLVEPCSAVKLTICRFIQEALFNAFKHAQGQGQRVEIGNAGSTLFVSVSDSGPGMPKTGWATGQENVGTGLGLSALATRVAIIGGTFRILSATVNGVGTTLQATFPVICFRRD